MNNKPLILLFEENEMNIAALYSLYAQKIPSKKIFWEQLSDEEIGHAAQIGAEKKSSESLIENKFSRGIIKYLMDFVLEEIARVQKSDTTHHGALLTALRIEQSMLEKKCFELFAPSNETVKQIFFKLNRETERHVEKLHKEMKENNFDLKDAHK